VDSQPLGRSLVGGERQRQPVDGDGAQRQGLGAVEHQRRSRLGAPARDQRQQCPYDRGVRSDPDIQINVEKGVVFISIADKLLFKSGSYVVSDRAKEVLAKVAKVVNSKPDFECMVEGHTDNVPIKNAVLIDNWDLSVKRATSIVRVLQEDLGVNPKQLIAAGRSFYVPLADNDTPDNRAKNRRTRIVVLPKIDQFYDMIEKEMKNMAGKN